jgi:predicted acetyltransferase
MAETFRSVRPEELPELARLAGHSFIGRPQEQMEEILAGVNGGLDSLWVAREAGGRAVALCALHSFRQWVGGTALPMMGLGLVAVSPAYRRRRAAARLVISGLRRARERGDLVSALYPFRVSFYESLGYGSAGEALQFVVPPATLPDFPERDGMRLVDTDADRQLLQSLYRRWSPGQNGQLERTPGMWTKALTERAGFLWSAASGEPEGYVLVRYRPDLPPEKRFLEVEERGWVSRPARLGIYGWLASLGDQWSQVAYRAHPEERFSDFLREPRLPNGAAPGWGLWFPSATLLMGPMFRLVNLERAWQERTVDTEVALSLRLEVADEQIRENGGSWTLVIADGRVEVRRGTHEAAGGTLRGTIAQISRIFVGSASPSQLVESGSVDFDRHDRLAALDQALRLPQPWTFDRF